MEGEVMQAYAEHQSNDHCSEPEKPEKPACSGDKVMFRDPDASNPACERI
jgi:hypothetical protein